ncbi:MAG: bifunctional pantoate--beta-alanine ligase/(d)CMP kinase [Oscillatoriales cyanobacterium]|nr:MAG: bifunctional pantoate--beta-alanine ligase/(d)CMP kinase [Oscillatoriales cyanobacterium]
MLTSQPLPLIWKTPATVRAWRRHQTESIGFVPTMGNLHLGHASLIERARSENAIVVVSIFVNPLQFAPTEDLDRYPQSFDADRELCQTLGVDGIFVPMPQALGLTPQAGFDKNQTGVMPRESMTQVMCGRSRPGHFTGVTTIVTKLLNIVQPDRVYFGQKDAQQLAIVRAMLRDLNSPVEICPCPIIREASGLAYSSRNQYLNDSDRQRAAVLFQALQQAAALVTAGVRDGSTILQAVRSHCATVTELDLDYVELVDPVSLLPIECLDRPALLALAARLGTTRLIDNIVLQTRPPIIAIDGPAGAGKSTVTRAIADRLGFLYLDTGAMYRAVTWWVMDQGIALEDEAAIATLVTRCDLDMQPQADGGCTVTLNGTDITQAIRTPEVTANVSTVAAQKAVREFLVKQQQAFGDRGGLVAEGRDMGTCVFPAAEVKIFLTATPAERARRRSQDLIAQGYPVDLAQLEAEIVDRDRQDSTREIAPLRQADDAIELVTDGMTIEAVIDRIISYVQGDILP